MKQLLDSWQFWAVLSAVAAAMTAIFAKLGVTGINSDFATFVRTIVVVLALTLLLTFTDGWQPLGQLSGRTWLFLVLSGLATGASWLFYFKAMSLGDASRVAPVDKLSVVFVAILAAVFLGERLSTLGWVGVGLIAVGSIVISLS